MQTGLFQKAVDPVEIKIGPLWFNRDASMGKLTDVGVAQGSYDFEGRDSKTSSTMTDDSIAGIFNQNPSSNAHDEWTHPGDGFFNDDVKQSRERGVTISARRWRDAVNTALSQAILTSNDRDTTERATVYEGLCDIIWSVKWEGIRNHKIINDVFLSMVNPDTEVSDHWSDFTVSLAWTLDGTQIPLTPSELGLFNAGQEAIGRYCISAATDSEIIHWTICALMDVVEIAMLIKCHESSTEIIDYDRLTDKFNGVVLGIVAGLHSLRSVSVINVSSLDVMAHRYCPTFLESELNALVKELTGVLYTFTAAG